MLKNIFLIFSLIVAFQCEAVSKKIINGDLGVTGNLGVTGTLGVTGVAGFANGSATAPSLFFTSDSDGTGTGLYRISANVLGVAINGVRAASFDSGKFKSESVINMTNNGTAGAPVYSFDNDANSGFYLVSASTLGLSTASTLRLSVSSSGVTFTPPALFANGSLAAPSMAFNSDADGSGTGFYRIAADNIGMSINGTLIMDASTARVSIGTKVNLLGDAAAGTAPAGYVGEVLTGTNTGGTSLTNGNSINITSVSLTAGDWDVWGFGAFSGSAAVSTLQVCGIGTTNTTLGTLYDGSRGVQQEAIGSQDVVVPVGQIVVNQASTVTYYLNCRADFSGGTITGGGKIWARRRR